MPDDAGLYERDWYAWTQDQAARLRTWPEHLRPNGLDVEHLAEEVEDLGGSQRRAVESFLELINLHCLKLEFYPAPEARQHWMAEIDGFRSAIAREFRHSPSLRARRADFAAEAWTSALRRFATALPADALPRHDLDSQILNEDWFPARLTYPPSRRRTIRQPPRRRSGPAAGGGRGRPARRASRPHRAASTSNTSPSARRPSTWRRCQRA